MGERHDMRKPWEILPGPELSARMRLDGKKIREAADYLGDILTLRQLSGMFPLPDAKPTCDCDCHRCDALCDECDSLGWLYNEDGERVIPCVCDCHDCSDLLRGCVTCDEVEIEGAKGCHCPCYGCQFNWHLYCSIDARACNLARVEKEMRA